MASWVDFIKGNDVPKRKRRNGTGTATGRGGSLHFGGLTSQQQMHGWSRGEKKTRSRALLQLESLCAIRAESSAFRGVMPKFEPVSETSD